MMKFLSTFLSFSSVLSWTMFLADFVGLKLDPGLIKLKLFIPEGFLLSKTLDTGLMEIELCKLIYSV